VITLVAVATGVTALTVSGSRSGEAAFPGLNGRIAYSSGDSYSYSSAAIWSINADGGSATLLSDGAGVAAPAYSADGARIAFDREGGIAVMSSSGSGLVQLLTGSDHQESSTEWRKDYADPHSGKVIPLVRIQSYVDEWHTFDHPSFSPDGSQLAIAEAGGKRTNRSICAVVAVGAQACLDWPNPNSYFNYEYDCTACGSHLVAIDSQTGAQLAALTALEGERRDTKPAYSASGKIAFARSSKGNSSIFVIDSPGSAPRSVTNGRGDRTPDFSPDGSRIAFSHGYEDIGVVGVGGGPVQLIPIPPPSKGQGGYVNSPAFSPDGSRIVFRRGVYGPGGQDESGLFTVALDGSGFNRIAAAGFAPAWQSLSPPPPPAVGAKARVKKGKVRLNRKGRAVIGAIVCGGTPCKLKVLSVLLSGGKRSCHQVRTRLARKLAPGKTARVGIKVYGKCLEALEKAGKGKLLVGVQVVDALGKRVLKLRSKLVPANAPKRKSAARSRFVPSG
jgi:dipeptidyl aminopeptidase/acylaminoacyl peptidase